MTQFYWHQSVVSATSNHQTGFLITVYIVTIALGIGKVRKASNIDYFVVLAEKVQKKRFHDQKSHSNK